MSYGVELINNRNFSIASINDVNYIFRSSGQISDADFYNGYGNFKYDISVTSLDVSDFNAPLIFFKSMNADQRVSILPGGGAIGGMFYPANTLIDTSSIDVFKWWNKNVGSLQYYIFDRWIPPERSGYGLQIFDSGGSIIFDSGWRFLKLKNVIWLDPGFPNHSGENSGSNWSLIGNGGSGNIAAAMPYARAWDVGRGAGDSYRLNECVHLDGNNDIFCSLVMTGPYLDMGPSGSGWANNNAKSQVMIADISGLPDTYNPVRTERIN